MKSNLAENITFLILIIIILVVWISLRTITKKISNYAQMRNDIHNRLENIEKKLDELIKAKN